MQRVRTSLFSRTNIAFYLLAFLCVCFLSPWLQRTLGTKVVVAFLGGYLFLEIDHLCKVFPLGRKVMVLIALYIGMLLLYTVLRLSDKGAGQTVCVLFMLTFFMIVPIYNRLNKRQCLIIILICILTMLFTMLQNYYLWERMGHRMTQQWYRTAGILEVVNTQYVSATVLFSGVLFSVFLYSKKLACRCVCLASAALAFLFNIVITQRAASLFISLAMFLLLYFCNGKNILSKGIRNIMLVLSGILFIFFYKYILGNLSIIVNSERLMSRINSLIQLMESQDVSQIDRGSLSGRIQLTMISINTFFSSPSNFFFGVGDKLDNYLVGNHCYFFDEFAKFGLFGGILSCSIIGGMILSAIYISSINPKERLFKLITAMYIIVVFRALTGGLWAPSIGIMINIFIPLAFKLMKYEGQSEFDMIKPNIKSNGSLLY
ncbi:MAG: hypothetical protein IKP00_03825 [Victivallales bacterium]|nr:hypothetical protein [Victivallales bacterium]